MVMDVLVKLVGRLRQALGERRVSSIEVNPIRRLHRFHR
jgi:hypothetical protein